MSRWFLGLVILLVVGAAVACGQATPSPTASPTESVSTNPTPTVSPSLTPTVSVSPSPTPETEATATPEALFLNVLTPEDESVVQAPTLEVKGSTTPDAVVTVNDQVVDVGSDGTFATTVKLEEGPNVIEIIASDFEGNQKSEVRTVIYAP